jgi:vitamin K-dependent gamma-carboxylase
MSKTKAKAVAHKHVPVPKRRFSWDEFKRLLGVEVSGASLAMLRIGIGIIMVLEAYSLWKPNHGSISSGRSQLETYFTGADITFHFPFPLFSWVPLLPPSWIYVTVGLVAVSGLLVALGLFYRAAIITLLLSYGYLWVAESTRTYWQSYYYIEVLVVLFLVWMPAQRMFSLDAWRARRSGKEWPQVIPFWPIFLLRAQLLIAYFYAGVAKINKDWLLDAAPVRWFLAEPGVLGPYEKFLSAAQFQAVKGFVESEGFAFFLSYTGLVFDLTVGFLFLFRRTRILALVLTLCFHAMNHFLIFDDIEWFPVVGIWTALIFLDPDWPLRFAKWVRPPFVSKPDSNWFWPGLLLIPGVGAALGWKMKESSRPVLKGPVSTRVAAVIAGWVILQILIPLRHYAIAGDGRFTYEGMSFSWRLKTEIRRAVYHELTIVDEAVLAGGGKVNWEHAKSIGNDCRRSWCCWSR